MLQCSILYIRGHVEVYDVAGQFFVLCRYPPGGAAGAAGGAGRGTAMMRNFKMLLAYDGSRYRGWQRLGDSDRTIQGKLEACLTALLQQPVQVSGAGRTDAGTHAIGQAASFRAETALPTAQLLRQLRAGCGGYRRAGPAGGRAPVPRAAQRSVQDVSLSRLGQ